MLRFEFGELIKQIFDQDSQMKDEFMLFGILVFVDIVHPYHLYLVHYDLLESFDGSPLDELN